jgi:aryl-alcohol dehydrogenase-like predicted oxidoreductase
MTLPEMALRFILSETTVGTVIPGMRSVKNVEANMATSDKGPLGRQLLDQLAKHRWVRQPTEWSQ